MSADEELGYVYLPFGTPANDYYGGHRHGDNLFGEALVCLEARTGKRDLALPVRAPRPVGLRSAGRAEPDRRHRGRPAREGRGAGHQAGLRVRVRSRDRQAAVADRGPPGAAVARAGREDAATQPFPTKPAPFEIQGVREDDLIDLTPALRAQALDIIGRYDHGPLYTPPTERGAIAMPGCRRRRQVVGGRVGSRDPDCTTSRRGAVPFVITLRPPMPLVTIATSATPELTGPQGLPLFKPPWAASWRSTCQPATTVAFRSRRGPIHVLFATSASRLGPARRPVLCPGDETVLLAAQSGFQSNRRRAPFRSHRDADYLNNHEPSLYAYDKASGRLLAEVVLPANASGAPMTYMAGGKQYVAFPIGGANITEELIALTLP